MTMASRTAPRMGPAFRSDTAASPVARLIVLGQGAGGRLRRRRD